MHRCFIESSWIDRFLLDPDLVLPEEVVHRLLKVVRIGARERFQVFDGQGRQIEGVISQFSPPIRLKDAKLEQEKAPTKMLILLQAAIEESKLCETLKRGTEFGIDRFIIFEAKNSDTFVLNKLKARHARLNSVVVDAARQCGRLFVPPVLITPSLGEAIQKEQDLAYRGFFGDILAEELLSSSLRHLEDHANVILVVGPEGGLNPQEMNELHAKGFRAVRWAPYVMRTELASLAAVAIVNAFWGKA